MQQPFTPLLLQDAIIDELRTTLPNFNPFSQFLPRRKSKEDAPPVPYYQVALGDGGDDAEEATQEVIIILGAKDQAEDRQGYRDVMNAIEKIRQRYKRSAYIKAGATVKSIKWTSPDDDANHPFYFGAVLLTCVIPQMEPVSDYT